MSEARRRHRAWALGLLACAGAVSAMGCRPRHPRARPHDAGTAVTAQVVEIAGCRAVRVARVCETEVGDVLTFWTAGDGGDLRVSHEGAALPVESRVLVQGGVRFTVRSPAAGGRLEVRARGGASTWTLAPRATAPEALARARKLHASSETDEARALAEPLAASADPWPRALALKLLGNMAFEAGDEAAVDTRFAGAIQAAEQAGVISEAANDAASWTFMLIEHGRFAAARAALEHARRYAEELPDARANVAFYEGRLAAATGRLRVALDAYREAAALSDELDLRSLGHGTREEIAFTLRSLGRGREALDDFVALRDEVEHLGSSACIRANAAQNVGATALEVPDAAPGEARGWLERAIALYGSECKTGATELASALGLLAAADLSEGDVVAATAHLAAARAKAPHPSAETTLDWLDVEGRIALARGMLDAAARAYAELLAGARSIGDRDRQSLALERRAEILARRGDRAGAVAELDVAGERVESAAADVPLGEGRDLYVGAHEGADRRAVELLVAMGMPDQALARLRRARARALASLVDRSRLASSSPERRARWEAAVGGYRVAREKIDAEAEDDWRFSAATLASRVRERTDRSAAARRALEAALAEALVAQAARTLPPLSDGDGDVTLAIEPGKTWIGFVAAAGRVRTVDLGVIDPRAAPDVLARAILAPFHDELVAARRVVLLPFGAARAIDLHALPLDGAPLGARAATVYGLDAGEPAEPVSGGHRALVVIDPSGDLPGARDEAATVTRALARASLRPLTLSGAEATGSAVRAELAGADLFHYAGHGAFAGRDGWESALPLAEHARLEVADVLALGHVPARVVLLGCETARASDGGGAEGLGLAQAFALAGARTVVAATRTVGDDAARAMATALYDALPADGDLAEAARGAYRTLSTGGTDWAAFRVIVP